MSRLLPRLKPTEDDTAQPILISALTGMGGIGKTALAIEAAHQACALGWFPGGTLFVDLRGYDDNPVTADQAVLALLDALGVETPDLPSTPARQHDAYRRLLAERQERTLLILDNASHSSHFVPLLPSGPRHTVLITSRDRPDALSVRVIDVDVLHPDESAALVARALRDADERDDRPSREPEALTELADICGHLPLALQIAAAMLRRRRHRAIASLVTEIRDVGDPTPVLDSGSPGEDLHGRSLTLRPVMETSYRRLASDQARLLRLLARAPGTEVSTHTVTFLADLDETVALSLLENLAASYLVTPLPDGEEAGSILRWRLHDLVRAFALGVLHANATLKEEGETARERVLEFYYRGAQDAAGCLEWLPGKPDPEQLADRAEALEWLDRERAGLVAAVQWAAEERHAATAVQLSACLSSYLQFRRYFEDWITVGLSAREAALRAGDQLGEARASYDLGAALWGAGRNQKALAVFETACNLYKASGDALGEARTWHALGIINRSVGRLGDSVAAHTAARDLYRSLGDPKGEADAWTGMGDAFRDAGHTTDAILAHKFARDRYRDTGDRYFEGVAWNSLGVDLSQAHRTREALVAHRKSLRIWREFQDWYRTGQALENLAVAYRSAGHTSKARTSYLQAADAYTRADDPDGAAQARAAASALE